MTKQVFAAVFCLMVSAFAVKFSLTVVFIAFSLFFCFVLCYYLESVTQSCVKAVSKVLKSRFIGLEVLALRSEAGGWVLL